MWFQYWNLESDSSFLSMCSLRSNDNGSRNLTPATHQGELNLEPNSALAPAGACYAMWERKLENECPLSLSVIQYIH